jgi:hypothetical protein
VAPEDEIAAEVTAMEMGWVPLKNEDGITIWVRSKDIVNDGKDIGNDEKIPYCITALEVIRTYTH